MSADEYWPKESQAVLAKQVPGPGHENAEAGKELVNWLKRWGIDYSVSPMAEVFIYTSNEGDACMKANPGDWLVQENGTIRIMTNIAFSNKYEHRLYSAEHEILMREVRPIIRHIALKAEQKMALNDPSKGDSWRGCSIEYLQGKLMEEVAEFFNANEHIQTRKYELADIVAVCAMLLARIKQEA